MLEECILKCSFVVDVAPFDGIHFNGTSDFVFGALIVEMAHATQGHFLNAFSTTRLSTIETHRDVHTANSSVKTVTMSESRGPSESKWETELLSPMAVSTH